MHLIKGRGSDQSIRVLVDDNCWQGVLSGEDEWCSVLALFYKCMPSCITAVLQLYYVPKCSHRALAAISWICLGLGLNYNYLLSSFGLKALCLSQKCGCHACWETGCAVVVIRGSYWIRANSYQILLVCECVRVWLLIKMQPISNVGTICWEVVFSAFPCGYR